MAAPLWMVRNTHTQSCRCCDGVCSYKPVCMLPGVVLSIRSEMGTSVCCHRCRACSLSADRHAPPALSLNKVWLLSVSDAAVATERTPKVMPFSTQVAFDALTSGTSEAPLRKTRCHFHCQFTRCVCLMSEAWRSEDLGQVAVEEQSLEMQSCAIKLTTIRDVLLRRHMKVAFFGR